MGLPLERFPDWPAAMTREVALAYSGVGESQLAEWERSGLVQFRRRGPHGALIARRDALDAALRALFGEGPEGESPEF